MARVAINGFGRIGRTTLRAVLENSAIDVIIVALNDLGQPEDLAYLFCYDSIYGEFEGDVSHTDRSIVIEGTEIRTFSEKDPTRLPWRDEGIDVVLECTGQFTDGNLARAHLDAGAKKVIISAPAKNEDITINLGVNDDRYDPEKHHIISNGSCTTNALSVTAKVIHQNFGIQSGVMTTIHSFTMSQKLLDGPDKKDKRRGRAAPLNMVPTTTGAARTIGRVLPELEGKLDGYAIRVPTPDVSLLDLVVKAEKPVSREEVNRVLREAAEYPLCGILGYSEAPLVSSDYIGDPRSCIVDGSLTLTTEDGILKVVGWYDNEFGFSCRLADVAEMVASQLPVKA